MKIRTRRWTTAMVALCALAIGGIAPWTRAADRRGDLRADRSTRATALAEDAKDTPLLDPVFGDGAGGSASSFGVVVSASPLQDDPTSDLPIEFEVTFEVPIDPSTFDASDVVQDGTAGEVVWEILNSGNDSTYQLRAVAVQAAGTIVPSLPEDAVTGLNVATNEPSVGVGNTVEFAGTTGVADPALLYVGMWNPGRVYTLRADSPTSLTPVGNPVDVPGSAMDLALAPSGDRLYYAAGSLFSLDLDPTTGAPGAPVSLASFPGNLDSLEFRPDGTKLYATQSQGLLLVFDFPGGVPNPPSQQIDGLVSPRGAILDPDDEYLYVANEFDYNFSTGSQEIARFDLDSAGSVVTGPVFTDYGPKPEHFAMDPCGDFLLHTQQPGRKVLTGDLGLFGAVTFDGMETAGPGALRLLLVPVGAGACVEAALYVTNLLEDTVSVFHVDSDGDLMLLEQEDTGVRPEDLIKHPTADYLYVLNSGDFTGQSSISIYEIDPATGALEPSGEVTIDDEGGFRLAIKDAS